MIMMLYVCSWIFVSEQVEVQRQRGDGVSVTTREPGCSSEHSWAPLNRICLTSVIKLKRFHTLAANSLPTPPILLSHCTERNSRSLPRMQQGFSLD